MKSHLLTFVIPALLVCGCKGVTKPKATPSTVGLVTTGTEAAFIPEGFGITNARFAVRDDGAIVPPPDGGDIVIVVQMVSTAGDFCDVQFHSTGPLTPTSWTGTTTVLAWERGDAAPTGSCGSVDLPDAWGDGLSIMDEWSWGVGITAEPLQTVLDRLPQVDEDALKPYLLGAGMNLPGLDDEDGVPGDLREWQPNAYAWGIDDNGDFIDADELVVDGELQPATYEVQAPSLLIPARALLY